MMKLRLNDVRVDQTARFYREGSVLGKTIKSGSLGIDVHVDIDSPEPAERIAGLIDVAKRSCFTHGALANPVVVEATVSVNGEPLEISATM